MTQKEGEIKIRCEVYSRIVGYLRPVQNWNKGKRQEFVERKEYVIGELEESRATDAH